MKYNEIYENEINKETKEMKKTYKFNQDKQET